MSNCECHCEPIEKCKDLTISECRNAIQMYQSGLTKLESSLAEARKEVLKLADEVTYWKGQDENLQAESVALQARLDRAIEALNKVNIMIAENGSMTGKRPTIFIVQDFVCDFIASLSPAPSAKDIINDPKMRGYFQMLICECNHKEHGHEGNTGACSRCDCKKFVENSAKPAEGL